MVELAATIFVGAFFGYCGYLLATLIGAYWEAWDDARDRRLDRKWERKRADPKYQQQMRDETKRAFQNKALQKARAAQYLERQYDRDRDPKHLPAIKQLREEAEVNKAVSELF